MAPPSKAGKVAISRDVGGLSVWSQVTNQMVKACKGYLTDEGLSRIWDQDRVTVINRIHDCLNLNRVYQDAFQRTKERMEETPGEKPFDFSQLYIFGKFEAFCRRLEKVSLHLKLITILTFLVAVFLPLYNCAQFGYAVAMYLCLSVCLSFCLYLYVCHTATLC